MKNKWLYSAALASVAAAVAIAPTAQAEEVSFKDVKAGTEQAEAIELLVGKKIISGYEDGTFRPGKNVTRAQAAKIIAGVLELDTENVQNPGFSDVSPNNANYKYIAALANLKIINGSNGKFNPSGTMTRGQMAKVLALAFELEGSSGVPFKDVKSDEAKKYVSALFENNITTGKTEERFGVNDPVTRGHLAVFIKRIIELENNELPKLNVVPNKFGIATISMPLEQGESLKYRYVNRLTYTPLYQNGSIAPSNLTNIAIGEPFIPWHSKIVQLYKVNANNEIVDGYQLQAFDFKKLKASQFEVKNNTLTIKHVFNDMPLKFNDLYFANNGQVISLADLPNITWFKDENGVPITNIQLPTTFKYDAKQQALISSTIAGAEVGVDISAYIDSNITVDTVKNNDATTFVYLNKLIEAYYNKNNSWEHSKPTEVKYIEKILSSILEASGGSKTDVDKIYLIGKYIDELQKSKPTTYKEVINVVNKVNTENKDILQKVAEAEAAVLALYYPRYLEMPMYERLAPTTTKEAVLAAEKLVKEVDQYEFEPTTITNTEYLLDEAKIAIGLEKESTIDRGF